MCSCSHVAVAVTGVTGLVLTRTLPPRINARGENIILERIPIVRCRLQEQAEALVLESVASSKVTLLGDLYREKLRRFFEVDRDHVCVAALSALADEGLVDRTRVSEAIRKSGIDPDAPNPATV